MCRNIKTLFNFDPPATDEEIRAASLQFVRKLSGFNKPSKANEAAFDRAIDETCRTSPAGSSTRSPPRRRRRIARKSRPRSGRGPWSGSVARPVPSDAVPPMTSSTRSTLFAGVTQDLRHGLRLLKREPGFSLLAILTIALGIGATTTLFSVADGVLMKPLPWPEADRLVRITESREGHDPRIRGTMSNGPFITWHADPTTIEDIGGWLTQAPAAIIGGSEPTRLPIAAVTPSLFKVLETPPLRGRSFIEDDAPSGGIAPGACCRVSCRRIFRVGTQSRSTRA